MLDLPPSVPAPPEVQAPVREPAKKKLPLPGKLALAIGAGCLTGALFGKRVAFLGELSWMIIQALKVLATPLIFFAILDAFSKTAIQPRHGLRLLRISLTNAAVAAIIALTVSYYLPLARYLDLDALRATITSTASAAPPPHLDLGAAAKGLIPQSVLEPFLTNNVIAVVLLALACGLSLRKLKSTQSFPAEVAALESFISGTLKLIMILLMALVETVPFAAFGILAKVVGSSGLQVFSMLGMFVGVVSLGLVLHVFFYYSLLVVLVIGRSPREFFAQAGEALLTALSTGSSLATLPVTLRTLQEKMKVSAQSTRLAAMVGTNLNHDGILLYEAVAALTIAQLHGISLGLGQKAALVLTAAVAAVGIGGIPDAGFISLSMVVSAAGLPLATVPLLLPVDWFLGRLRAATNVSSDILVAHWLDKLEGAAQQPGDTGLNGSASGRAGKADKAFGRREG